MAGCPSGAHHPINLILPSSTNSILAQKAQSIHDSMRPVRQTRSCHSEVSSQRHSEVVFYLPVTHSSVNESQLHLLTSSEYLPAPLVDGFRVTDRPHLQGPGLTWHYHG